MNKYQLFHGYQYNVTNIFKVSHILTTYYDSKTWETRKLLTRKLNATAVLWPKNTILRPIVHSGRYYTLLN